jgi:2-polyprenyl-3-methyl-5-hydroxy-6-metoxy-1,4-benzoquinol methylase
MIAYIRNKKFLVNSGHSIVDTEFFVNHDRLGEMMKRSSSGNKPWTLGELGPGQEWLAFTFRTQTPRRLTRGEFDLTLQDHEIIVKEAYARMALDHAHKWAAHGAAETEFAVTHLQLRPGFSVLDAGCQTGRHSIELAKRGYRTTGVDFVPSFVERASAIAAASGLSDRAKFVSADCRHLSLGERFDAALCLYDVVGTFADNSDNLAVLRGIANHLKRGGAPSPLGHEPGNG